jgi:hypothetical protein
MLHQVDPKGTPESIGIQPFSSNGRLVYGAAIDIGALRVIFTFGSPDYTTHYRPSGVRFRRQDATAEKVVDSIGQKLDIHSSNTFECHHRTRDDAWAGAIGQRASRSVVIRPNRLAGRPASRDQLAIVHEGASRMR